MHVVVSLFILPVNCGFWAATDQNIYIYTNIVFTSKLETFRLRKY